MISVNLDLGGLDAVVREVQATDEQVRKALRSTVAKMARWLRTRATRSLSKELQIKRNVLRYRMKDIKLRQAPDGSLGGLWIGLNELDFVHLGGADQDAQGVNYRGEKFPGAFFGPRPGKIAPKLNGRAFKRTGSARLPIEKVGLPIEDKANKTLESDVMELHAFEAQFLKTLEHELRWRTQTLK